MQGKIIVSEGRSEVIIKKSRFLGFALPVEDEDSARKLIQEYKKQYYDARHVCYAYSIGSGVPRLKFSDDGEPGGTAGKPILDVVSGSGVQDMIIIVVRYFGGILLGTGGLVKAYTEAAAEALRSADIRDVCLSDIYDVTIGYNDLDKIKYYLDKQELRYEISYTDNVKLRIIIPTEQTEEVLKDLTDTLAGKIDKTFIEQKIL